MTTSLSSNRLLISALAKRQRSKNALQAGFTLVELLVVIIIIGILAAVALPAFLNQADKGKGNAAKSLVSAAAKECQAFLVDPDPDTFSQTTGGGGNSVTLEPIAGTDECDEESTTIAGTWTATVAGKNWTYTAIVASDGTVSKTCSTGGYGCSTTSW